MNYTIKPMERKIEKEYLFESLCEDLKKLQAENENLRKALEQEPKTGHWIENYAEDGCGELYSHWICSECGRSVGFNYANIEDVLSEYPYCHCGAKMIELQAESEEYKESVGR